MEKNHNAANMIDELPKNSDGPRSIHEVLLRERQTESSYSSLKARIESDGDLVLEGYDAGENVMDFFGDDDYEFFLIVKKEHKDAVLLYLIKDQFTSDVEFRKWLDVRGIPSKLDSWI